MELPKITTIITSMPVGFCDETAAVEWKEAKGIAIQWVKHFAKYPHLENLGSMRTLTDLFDIKEEELR